VGASVTVVDGSVDGTVDSVEGKWFLRVSQGVSKSKTVIFGDFVEGFVIGFALVLVGKVVDVVVDVVVDG
jgi:hypothetical protein